MCFSLLLISQGNVLHIVANHSIDLMLFITGGKPQLWRPSFLSFLSHRATHFFMNPSFYMQFNTRSREHMDIDCATILKSWFLVFSILLDVIFIWGQISSSTWCMCVDVISISWGNDSKYIDVVREYCFNILLFLFWI